MSAVHLEILLQVDEVIWADFVTHCQRRGVLPAMMLASLLERETLSWNDDAIREALQRRRTTLAQEGYTAR